MIEDSAAPAPPATAPTARVALLLAEDLALAAAALPWDEPDVEVVLWDGTERPAVRRDLYDAVSIAGFTASPQGLRAAVDQALRLGRGDAVRIGAATTPAADAARWTELDDLGLARDAADRPVLSAAGSGAGADLPTALLELATATSTEVAVPVAPAGPTTPQTLTAPGEPAPAKAADPAPTGGRDLDRLRPLALPAALGLVAVVVAGALSAWLGDAVVGALAAAALVVSAASLLRGEQQARRIDARLRAVRRDVSALRRSAPGTKKGGGSAASARTGAIADDVAAVRRGLGAQQLASVEAAEVLHRIEARLAALEAQDRGAPEGPGGSAR